jgi:hypothetical protein
MTKIDLRLMLIGEINIDNMLNRNMMATLRIEGRSSMISIIKLTSITKDKFILRMSLLRVLEIGI